MNEGHRLAWLRLARSEGIGPVTFARLIETAGREPVVIRRQKRDVAVVLSMEEYERLTRLNVSEFQRFCDQVGERAAQAGMDEAALGELLGEQPD